MAFNLLRERWLPVAVPGEAWSWRTPTEAILAPPGARLAWPRADFCGAAHEFLIGLLSVALAPRTDADWRAGWETPPTAADLDAAFAPLIPAFDLDGPGPRFLQDSTATEDGRLAPVAALLIDAPGENALKRNLDFFVKRAAVEALCPRCAAMALHTLQTYAPSGGQGHRTGLRGGGPLTTLAVKEGDLWRTLWANVLPWQTVERDPIRMRPAEPAPVFPWMGPVASRGKDAETHPGDAAWLQSFFGQPRRIWLAFEGAGCCDVCGEAADARVREWHTRPRGVNYKGGWMHPLSPWRRETGKPETLSARKGNPHGPDWRDWLGLVETPQEISTGKGEKVQRGPAPAVAALRRRFASDRTFELRLWAFGYDTDNMKARGWNDAEMPLLPIPADSEGHAQLRGCVTQLVRGANEAVGHLVYALKRAHSTRPADVSGDFHAEVANLLDRLGAGFEAHLRELTRRALAGEKLGATATLALREAWLASLQHAALAVYDEAAAHLPVEAYDQREAMQKPIKDRRGPVTGRLLLSSALMEKLRPILGLPEISPRGARPAGKGAA